MMRMKRRSTLYAVLLIIAIYLLIFWKTDNVVNNTTLGRRSFQDDVRTQSLLKSDSRKKIKTTSRETKTIVWYDTFNNGHGLRNKARHVKFESCEYKNCVFGPAHIVKDISNSALEVNSIQADAVIFQGTHLSSLQMPRRDNPDQVFVFAERESWMFYGADTKFEAHKYANVFNWTMTYRRDSDIPLLYGDIHRVEQKKTRDTNVYKTIFDSKKRDIVWLVSNCASKSLREDYVSELRKYITVDIIGDCGSQTCPKKDGKGCLSDIIKRYKFILSFENTFHKDYVTEKLFDWFNRDIIQVVYGLANYSVIAPAGTLINSARFDSPKSLAKFLKKLSADRTKYVSFLKRKEQFVAVDLELMHQRAYCELCRMLHNVSAHRRTYEHVGRWWGLNSTRGINPFVSERVVKIGELIKIGHNSTDAFIKELKKKQLV